MKSGDILTPPPLNEAGTITLLPTILVGLTAFITTVVVEAIYFVCHLWRCLFDGSTLSFSWVEPLPAAGISAGAVLLVGFIAARLMSHASGNDRDSIDDGFRPHLVSPRSATNPPVSGT
jgi:hypothetical protein